MYRNSAGLSALFALGSVLVTGNASATAVSATAELSGLIQTLGPSLTLSNDFYTQDVVSSVLPESFATGTSPQDLVLNGGSVYAESSYSLFSLPYTNIGVIGKGSASSQFQWSFDFVASGTGTVTLDFGYDSVANIANLAAGDRAGVSSRIDVLRDGVPSSEVERFYFIANQNGLSDVSSDILLTFDVVAGQHGSITFTASSQGYVNPVPLPAGIWLLTSALGALGVVRRRIA